MEIVGALFWLLSKPWQRKWKWKRAAVIAAVLVALNLVYLQVNVMAVSVANEEGIIRYSTPLAWWDRHVIDQFFNFTAWGAHAAAEEARDMQSGNVQQYAIWFLAGSIALTILLLI